MAGQLIPPPELAPPPLPRDMPPQERIASWLELVKSSEALYIAGLQQRAGPGDNWKSEYARRFALRRDDRLERRLRRDAELANRRSEHDS